MESAARVPVPHHAPGPQLRHEDPPRGDGNSEAAFAEDLRAGGLAGLSVRDVRLYLELIADQRLAMLGLAKRYGSKNPFPFMDLQDVQELANFFERRVSAYQVGVTGAVALDAAF